MKSLLQPNIIVKRLKEKRKTLAQLAMADVMNELLRAQLKFPGNATNLEALAEEFGELNKALMEQHFYEEKFSHLECAPPKPTDEDVYKEAIQVAVMALRIATEGVKGRKYRNPYICRKPAKNSEKNGAEKVELEKTKR